MVKNTGAQAGTGALRALNVPVAIQVEEDAGECPKRVKLKAQWLAVEQIVDRWRIDDEWWREKPISRAYYQILAEDGRGYTLFHDLANERWYRQGHA